MFIRLSAVILASAAHATGACEGLSTLKLDNTTITSAQIVAAAAFNLPGGDRHKIGIDLMRVQFGWPIGMPLVRSLGDGLWEVRSDLPSNRTARLLLCFHRAMLVVLHGFIKKAPKT